MSKSTKDKARAKVESKARDTSAYQAAARRIPILALVWIGLSLASAIAALCPRFTVFYAVYIAIALGLAAGSLAFLDAIHRKGRTSLHPGFKKFLGYGLVVQYAAAALPRVDWASSGLIGQGRVVFLFVLEAVTLAAGVVLFVASGRPATYAGLGLIEADEVEDKELRKKRAAESRKKGLLRGTLEWVDALGFAAILVILIQTFVFQLYEIPSESMVPSFLIRDRPFTSKIDAAPRIPLTDWRLPWIRLPARGDIITMANPRYPENQSVNLKKYLAQFVSMITFTAVNIDKYLPDGSIKADPLVKRVVGLPGEKLMMVDDVLYHKRAGDQAFSPVEEDKKWARVDLWKEDPETVSRINEVKINSKQRDALSAWDARRRSADPARLAASIAASAAAALQPVPAAAAERFLSELSKQRPNVFTVLVSDRDALLKADPAAGNPIALAGTRADDLALVLALNGSGARASSSQVAALRSALSAYAAVPGAAVAPESAYERGGRAINLLVKDNLLARAGLEARLLASGATFQAMADDPELKRLTQEAGDLELYVNGPDGGGLYDARNFPPFPSGDSYLGPRQYFAMGDNRYNSLDFRYRTGGYSLKALDPNDPASVQYYSNVDPFALDLRFIEGYALFRIWPPSRVGAIR